MHNKFGNTGPGVHSAESVGGGAESSTESDFVLRFSTAVSSSLSRRTGAVQYSIVGIAGLDFEIGQDPTILLEDDTNAEGTDDAEQYSAPGIIGRPLPPRVVDGNELHMDVVCVQTTEGLIPIAYRDLRLVMAGDAAPGEGVLAFVGYGGGFHSMTPVELGVDPAGGGTIHVVYCPYEFTGGVATKAHSIILDPTPGNESILVAHADGQAVIMFDSKLVFKSPDGSSNMTFADGTIDIVTGTLTINAGVVLGDALTAVPLLAGAASPPSSTFFVSP